MYKIWLVYVKFLKSNSETSWTIYNQLVFDYHFHRISGSPSGVWSIALIYVYWCREILSWTILLPLFLTTFKMPYTRLNSNQTIAEQLGSVEDVCFITKEALDLLVREMADARRDQIEIDRNIAQSLEKIANSMAEMSANAVSTSANLCQKLDDLTVALKSSNATLSAQSTSVDEYLKQRKSIAEKIARHELVSSYYDELLKEQSPFARKEFRQKVNKNASETDLRHRRQQTIDNVKVEINLMQDRLTEFNEKKRKLDEKIDIFLQQNEDSRLEIQEQVQAIDRKAREEYERDKLSLMKKTDEEEKRTTNEYLISFQGEERDSSSQRENSKNSRGRYHRRPPRNNRR